MGILFILTLSMFLCLCLMDLGTGEDSETANLGFPWDIWNSFGSDHTIERPDEDYDRPGSGTHSCSHCGRLFRRRFHLQEHLFTHVPDRPRPFSCGDCPKKFFRKYDLERHLLSHQGRRDYACPDVNCHWSFSRLDALKRHMRTRGHQKPSSSLDCRPSSPSLPCSRSHSSSLSNHIEWRPFSSR